MFFPWVGLFEQIRLADLFVHYNDVQFPQGRSFCSRVQIKMKDKIHWLTVPVTRKKEQLIIDVKIDESQDWRGKHLQTLKYAYGNSVYCNEMIELVKRVYYPRTNSLCEMNIKALEEISRYFELETDFMCSSDIGASSTKTERLIQLLKKVNASVYITGWGAKNYLNHENFEEHNIRVEYMEYTFKPYVQLYGDFTPYVSILDLIANVGSAGKEVICSGAKYWKEVVYE